MLLQQGQHLDEASVAPRRSTWCAPTSARARCSPHEILRGAKGRTVRPKTAGQKRYVDAIRDNVITFGLGPAGTGKSWLAVAMAVQALQAKQVQRIILTRPAVEAGERLGFLPGDLMAKVDPYLRPLYDALYDMVEPEGAQQLLERQTVEVAPLAFMRGRTLNNSFIILDEAQNTTPEQMKMFLTRIGFGSKVVVTGDTTQVDVPGGRSGLHRPRARSSTGIDGLAFVHLTARRRGAPPDRRRHRRRLRARRGDATAVARERRPPTSARPAAARRRRRRPRGVRAPTSRPTCRSTSPAGHALAEAVLRAEGVRGPRRAERCCSSSEDEIAELNEQFMGKTGPTDVLAFPIDADRGRGRCRPRPAPSRGPDRPPPDPGDLPLLLGDVVICPAVAAAPGARARRHARRRAGAAGRARRAARARPRPRRARRDAPRCGPASWSCSRRYHWHGPAPAGFRQEQPG